MRPLELSVEGFRSYRHQVRFDWRNRRLVGIVGPIGAGKSSVLDAIAFALYGKTPGVGSATRSLIHQLCDEAHVALTFKVDDEIWRAVRAPKRKGQSGHQLVRLAEDDPQAEAIETVTQEGPVNEQVEQLLGMDFQTFCRSVLLAQNRFSDFLKATRAERDKVLKGVFGYERLDAAKAVADRRLEHEALALESLERERVTIGEARGRLDEARERAEAAALQAKDFDGAAPQVERLEDARRTAEADAGAAATLIDTLERVAASLPAGDQVEALLDDAGNAHGAVERAKVALASAEAARDEADAELASVRDRLGDRSQMRTFEQLVERHDVLARDVERATKSHTEAESHRAATAAALEEARARSAAAAEAAASAEKPLAEAVATTSRARDALAAAQHAEMAHELRGRLSEGAPCPVCAQPVATLPKRGAAPKAIAAARTLLAEAEAGEATLRSDRERLATAVGAAEAAVTEAERRLDEAELRVDAADAHRRAAEAELTAAKDQLTERLGDGEPRELIEARASELAAAEDAAARAATAVETARGELDAARERAEAMATSLASLATDLAGTWGALGVPRSLGGDPASLRSALADVREELVTRLDEASEARTEAAQRAVASADALAGALAAIGLEPDDDFIAARAQVVARHATALGAIEELETQIARSSELERLVFEAEARRAIALRLTQDLKPARFLAFLLEEERAELAELGSGLFETLTDGNYRFAADDSFDILDLNAADRTRKADSLSGGETFLASLALALALAEMVARGGGRLDAFFLDEGFGSLDPEHLDRAMAGIERLVSDDDRRLVVVVSHVAEMREAIEDLIVLDKDGHTGDTVVVAGATRP
ncbi:MAG: SMC family ATPase [Actinomycetota bacterium]|nr:SMC family ATPase [Actinomycetota bacterium]MDH5312622.1 SMC family ATPase [Actinomycetota bacterium]